MEIQNVSSVLSFTEHQENVCDSHDRPDNDRPAKWRRTEEEQGSDIDMAEDSHGQDESLIDAIDRDNCDESTLF